MSKFYDKCFLKIDHNTGKFTKEVDKVAKHGCPLEERHVKILNRSWETNGILYMEVNEEKPKSDTRLKLEAEAKELGITFRDNIGDEKLQEKINKAIEE